MGRELKRVPVDFDWPVSKTWHGFVNSHYAKRSDCAACGGSGHNKVGRFLSDTWYRHTACEMFGNFFGDNILSAWTRERIQRAGWPSSVGDNIEMAKQFQFTTLTHWSDKLAQDEVDKLVAEGRLRDLTHTWSRDDGWQPKELAANPTPDEVAVWNSRGLGHDAINEMVCVEARAKRFGHDNISCEKCGGSGEFWANEEDETAAEAWEAFDPPTGDGYQIWETVSEGSPVSPVFAKPEELAHWMVEHDDSVTRDTTYEGWLVFINGPGWAPSMIGVGNSLRSGVAAVSDD